MPLVHSVEIEKLAAALAKAQGEMEDAREDSLNPHFKSAYADLASVRAAVRKPLSANGLSYVQFPEADGNRVSCETMLMHDSGQWMRGTLTVVAQQANTQGIGSAITYSRRYSLMAVLGIAPSEDDDGNEVVKKAPNDNRRTEPLAGQPARQEAGNNDDPFADAPPQKKPVEPAVSSLAIKFGRDLKNNQTIPDLEAWKKQPEPRQAFNQMNDVDRKYVESEFKKHRASIEKNDIVMAG